MPKARLNRLAALMFTALYCWRVSYGLCESAPINLSLRRSIEIAIDQSPEFQIIRADSLLASQDVTAARGAFDTVLKVDSSVTKSVFPTGSSLFGSEITETSRSASISLSKMAETGTKAGLSLDTGKNKTTRLFTNLNPQYESEIMLSLNQPLLKGAWKGRPGIIVKIKKKQSLSSFFTYQSVLTEKIMSVVRTYWRAKLSELKKGVKQKSLDLAEEFLKEATLRVKLGLQPITAISQAKAEAALRQGELIIADNEQRIAFNLLMEALGLYDSKKPSNKIVLTDAPSFRKLDFEIDKAIQKALKTRPEIKALEEAIRSLKLKEDYDRNQLLPELTLSAGLGLKGLTGSIVNEDGDIPIPSSPLSSDFEGKTGDSLDMATSGDFYSYILGLTISHPLENRAAKARFNSSHIQLRTARHRLAATKQRIIVEVKNAASSLSSAAARIKAAEEAVNFATKSLSSGEKRFKTGLATPREILELQKDLAEAELARARALADYEISLMETKRATGELLTDLNISIER